MLLSLLGGLCEADLPELDEFLTNVMLLLSSVSYFSYYVFNLDSSSSKIWLLIVNSSFGYTIVVARETF